MYSWGWNGYGQIGDGIIENRFLPTRIDFSHVTTNPIASIYACGWKAFAQDASGHVSG